MATIDCVLIGHNELSIARNKRMLLYLYGKSSHEYRDRIKYNLSQVVMGRERYSPTELYNPMLPHRTLKDTSTAHQYHAPGHQLLKVSRLMSIPEENPWILILFYPADTAC